MITMTISGTLYNKCEDYSGNCWSNQKVGSYGSGILNNKQDRHKIERLGKIGECALGLLINEPVDFSYQKFGDQGIDFMLGDFKVDLKTASRDTGKCLIKAENGRSGPVRLVSDVYVCAYLVSECIGLKTATVCIVGYLTKKEVQQLEVRPGVKGFSRGQSGWTNYIMDFNKVHDIQELIELKDLI